MRDMTSVLRPIVLLAALIVCAAMPARSDTVAAKPEVASPVSAQGQRIYEATRAHLLQVRTLLKDQDSQASVGSGFVVDASGLAITNYHVVSQFALRPERYRLAFTMAQGRIGSAELLAIDVIHDLALLRLRGAEGAPPIEFTPLPFRAATAPLAKGERLYSMGNPLDVGFAVVEGVYNGPVERSFLPQIFFGGSLNPGMSGGPAVDDAGRVIGVNVAARRDGEQVSFLVPAALASALAAARARGQAADAADVCRGDAPAQGAPGRAGRRICRAAVAQRQPPALPRAGAAGDIHALLGQRVARDAEVHALRAQRLRDEPLGLCGGRSCAPA